MDNDIKVIDKASKQRHKDVLLFLQSELEPLKKQAGGNAYNLEKEYEKTSKNKSLFVIFMILGCVLVIGLAFFIMNLNISKNNREVTVNLEEFDGVNLKDLIDNVSRTQERYDEALKSLTTLKGEMTVELKNAEDKRDSDLMVIESLKLKKKSDEQQRKQTVEEIYAETVRQIHEKYDKDITAGELQVEQYKAQVDEFDAAKFNAAREKEQALDSERQLQELKQKELTTRYENRISKLETNLEENRRKASDELKRTVKEVTDTYQARIDLLDPYFNDARGSEIVSQNTEIVPRFEENPVFGEKGQNLKDKKLLEEYNQALETYRDYKYLQTKISGIPHEREVPSYLKTSRTLIDEMTEIFVDSSLRVYNEKEAMQADYERKLAQKEAELRAAEEFTKSERARYEDSLEGTMTALKTSALVITVYGPQKIEVYVAGKARYLIKDEGTRAEIQAGKVKVKGFVVNEDSKFWFKPETDETGKMTTPFLLEEMLAGSAVKLYEK